MKRQQKYLKFPNWRCYRKWLGNVSIVKWLWCVHLVIFGFFLHRNMRCNYETIQVPQWAFHIHIYSIVPLFYTVAYTMTACSVGYLTFRFYDNFMWCLGGRCSFNQTLFNISRKKEKKKKLVYRKNWLNIAIIVCVVYCVWPESFDILLS